MQEFGHHVRLATHANFRTFVRSAGVDFYPLGGDPRVLAGCKRSPIWKFLLYKCYIAILFLLVNLLIDCFVHPFFLFYPVFFLVFYGF